MKKIFLVFFQFIFSIYNPPKKIRDFIMWPLASRTIGTTHNEFVKQKNGLKLYTDLRDILGRLVLFYGPSHEFYWEPQTMKFVKELVRNKKTCIVAGAHIGLVALSVRKYMTQPNSKVYTFEPVTYLYDICKKNIEINKYNDSVILSKLALSKERGEMDISIDTLRSSLKNIDNNADIETAQLVSLDSFVQDNDIKSVDLMLLDVEGAELDVLLGAKEILRSNSNPEIIFEVIKDNIGLSYKIIELLKSYGYKFYSIKDDYEISLNDIGSPKLTEINTSVSIEPVFKDSLYVNIFATKSDIENYV